VNALPVDGGIADLYPAGLNALVELVAYGFPKKALEVGPYSAFLRLIGQNQADWAKDKNAKGHLVGMGMGSIYDVGEAPTDFRHGKPGFSRYWDGLKRIHHITWRCAEVWTDAWRMPTEKIQRALILELSAPPDPLHLSGLICRRCAFKATRPDWIVQAAKNCEGDFWVKALLKKGGKKSARQIIDPPGKKLKELRRRLAEAVAQKAALQDLEILSLGTPTTHCPRCKGDLIGLTAQL
jgi:hypothetical protein